MRQIRGLVALNGALLVVLAAVSLPGAAEAQPGNRKRGEYTMVGGAIQGGSSNAIVVVDAANQEMIALRWNESSRTLEGLDYRDLAADSKVVTGQSR